ncbi:hypothetical protein [Pelagicoccus albus]|uniref:Cytochrome c domain-containing protein n=1 Tax=Pelagicoccus albus TaxID=415222 RepID=A0A7X1EA35_9BACT|nr:hypothetical protein [Pelagicoccus albus]MBC2607848.1 hypothetical protein [Pelagicoccus albus]
MISKKIVLTLLSTAASVTPLSRVLSQQSDSTTRGAETLQNLCIACHQTQPSHELQEKGLAPPLWGVRDHYLEKYPDRETFVEAIVAYLPKPEADKSLMKGAIKRFGIMPPLPLPEDALKDAANAMYDAEGFQEPTWWAEHVKAKH